MVRKRTPIHVVLLSIAFILPNLAATALVIPSGAEIVVRTTEAINGSQHLQGDLFKAVIDEDVIVDGKLAIPAGEEAKIRLARARNDGRDVGVRLHSLRVGGKSYRVFSELAVVPPEKKGRSTVKTTAIASGVGAAVGAIAGGGQGALIGAGAGAGAGLLISALSREKFQLPAEARLSFRLQNSLKVQ